ncbi:hypothetical protein OQA88_7945 [Cercophora sp. LCS_1]
MGVDINWADASGFTALLLAVESGNAVMAGFLMDQGADVNCKDERGHTALWRGAWYGQEDIAAALLQRGTRPDDPDHFGETPPSIAAYRGPEGILKLFQEAGQPPNALTSHADHTGTLPAVRLTKMPVKTVGNDARSGGQHTDSRSHDTEDDAEDGIEDDDDPEGGTDEGEDESEDESDGEDDDETEEDQLGGQLLRAAFRNKILLARRLLRIGADVNWANRKGQTPLHYAVAGGATDMVELLFDQGATLEAPNRLGFTALLVAAVSDSDSAASSRILLERGANIESRNTVQVLLEHRADATAADDDKTTALWHAANRGHDAAVLALIDHGADIESCSIKGVTPLMSAAARGRASTVRVLLERGARVLPGEEGGRSPLCLAALTGQEAIVEDLISFGADANYRAADGKAHYMDMGVALTKATTAGQEEIVKLSSHATQIKRETEEARFSGLKYKNLRDNIRLLSLYPGKGNELIRFDLFEVNFREGEQPVYEAVSYEWGEKIGTVELRKAKEALQEDVSRWEDRSKDDPKFDFEVCEGGGLQVIPEVGVAEEGMVAALIGGSPEVCLLRKKQINEEDVSPVFFEYAGVVRLPHIHSAEIERLEDVEEYPKVEQLEIR